MTTEPKKYYYVIHYVTSNEARNNLIELVEASNPKEALAIFDKEHYNVSVTNIRRIK